MRLTFYESVERLRIWASGAVSRLICRDLQPERQRRDSETRRKVRRDPSNN